MTDNQYATSFSAKEGECGIVSPETGPSTREGHYHPNQTIVLQDHPRDGLRAEVGGDAGLDAFEAVCKLFVVLGMEQLTMVVQLVASAVSSCLDTTSLLDALRWLFAIIGSNSAVLALNVATNWLFELSEATRGIMRLLKSVQEFLVSLRPNVSLAHLYLELLRFQAMMQLRIDSVSGQPTATAADSKSTSMLMEWDSIDATSPSTPSVASPRETNASLPCKCSRAGGCPGFIQLPSCADIKNVVAAHMEEYHGIPRTTSAVCPWAKCKCSPQAARGDCPRSVDCTNGEICAARKCKHRPPPHPAHVKDIADHIVKCHLNFRYGCGKCGQSTLKSDSAVKRHRKKCKGTIPVSCGLCYADFDSEFAFGRHVSDCPMDSSTPSSSAHGN